jgi:hypothetical protein
MTKYFVPSYIEVVNLTGLSQVTVRLSISPEWSLHFTTWYSTLFASYIGYIHAFWWLLGIIQIFPSFIRLTWESQKTYFSMFLTFRDPNRVQITWNFGGTRFSTEQDLGAKDMQHGSHEGQTGMAHAARFLGRMAYPFPPIAPMPSIFVSLDASWPKTIYKKGPLRVAKRSAAETQKHETEAWEIKDWRGKLQRGVAGVISIPSNDSTFITMMKRE